MSEDLGGVLSFVSGGRSYTIEGSATYSVQKFMRESQTSLTKGVAGTKRVPAIPFIEVSMFDTKGINIEELANIKSETAQLDLYNGKSVVLYRCSQVGTIEPDAAEATFTFRLEGEDGKVLRPATG